MKPTWSDRRQSTVMRTRDLDIIFSRSSPQAPALTRKTIHSFVRYILDPASEPQSSADHSDPFGTPCPERVPSSQKPETLRLLQIAFRSVVRPPRKVLSATSLLALEGSSRHQFNHRQRVLHRL